MKNYPKTNAKKHSDQLLKSTTFRKYSIISEPVELYGQDLDRITGSNDAANVLRPIFNPFMTVYEAFYILCLNNNNKVVGFSEISKGGITGTFVDIRLLAKIALDTLATSVILAHNHPSGNLTPSRPDKMMTNKVKEAFAPLDINVLDHIILSESSYLSFADEGII